MSPTRRQFLKALGLSGAVTTLPFARTAFESLIRADEGDFPTRIVFFVTPHGHVWPRWQMPIPGVTRSRFGEMPLAGLSANDFSDSLRPLHPFRDRLLAIDGISRTSALFDQARIQVEGGDINNHTVASAHTLTGARALQRQGLQCIGGATSIDQILAARTGAPGRFSSRNYGTTYVGGTTSSPTPFSFLAAGQSTPIVNSPRRAFEDLLGYYVPRSEPGTRVPRDELLNGSRESVLDAVAEEYDQVARQLSWEGQQKLEQHHALIRDLERSLSAGRVSNLCNPTFDEMGHEVSQFMRLTSLALACDLTRVVTFNAPVPQCPEFGYPESSDVHVHYAHGSVNDRNGGDAYSFVAEQAMTDLSIWYARHFGQLLAELDAVPEGSGTLLDHTAVVWITELATPTHQHRDTCTVIAGGANRFFSTGRYIHYARDVAPPLPLMDLITQERMLTGPAHNKLLVSLMQAMGQPDTSFGLTEATSSEGEPISMTGPLLELHA